MPPEHIPSRPGASDVPVPSAEPSAPPLSPPDEPIPRLPIMPTRGGGGASPLSSPRRPRRAGTGIPPARRTHSEFDPDDSLHGRGARDEFEEEFLNRAPADSDGQIINQHLEGVDFRQLDDDEEVLSDDADEAARGEAAARLAEAARGMPRPRVDDRSSDGHFDTIDLNRVRQSTVRSNWRRVPSEVGCEGCEGCDRLCGENRRLRRQLDELEFELASGVLHNPADGFDPPQVVKAVPAIPQIPIANKKGKGGWKSKLRAPTSVSISTSKPSERARLKSEVQALTVTTEYLWRKLNKAEMELRNYRRKDLRNRMKMNEQQNEHTSSALGAHVRSADWEWE